MSFSVDVSTHQGGAERIILAGRLDSNTAPDLEQVVEPLVASPPGTVIFDLGKLEYISSAGLRVVFRVQKAVRGADGQMLVVNLQPQVRKVFEIIDALPSMAVFKSYEEMDEYLDLMQRREVEKRSQA